jgi:(p)ppGpp synthase/HD superfamily hydrolase
MDSVPSQSAHRPLVGAAYAFAADAHREQRRKDGQAFIGHPVRVARLLAARGYGDEVIAAALLHDVVEDTPITLAQLRERFGDAVAALVDWVTEDVRLPVPERRRAYRERVRRGPRAARDICAADKLCNAADLHQAAEEDDRRTLARFFDGLAGQVARLQDDLAMLDEAGADPALRDAIRDEIAGLQRVLSEGAPRR